MISILLLFEDVSENILSRVMPKATYDVMYYTQMAFGIVWDETFSETSSDKSKIDIMQKLIILFTFLFSNNHKHSLER